ncbi:MAG: hypothetical protein Q8R01_05345 [Ramlibacter sp.]|nr:hypothetical protein [Ramlibacter sp.]
MNCTVHIDSRLTDAERRARLYAGDIFIFSPNPHSLQLVALAREMIEQAFNGLDPLTLSETLPVESVVEVLRTLKPRFIHHPTCKQLIPALLEHCGADLDKVYFDVPRLRTAYPSHFLSSGIAYAFHPHRDTWYAAPAMQLNWWLPIYPLDRENCMGFYPGHFDMPVRNNSETYNYYRWNEQSRASAAQHVRADTREQPKPQEEVKGPSLRYLPPPGGCILFSGAQLHETVRNTSGVARYSIDFRTVDIDDVKAHRGARNVDARSTGSTLRDYLKASSPGEHLPDGLVGEYDDGSEGQASILYFGDRLVRENQEPGVQ